MQIICLGDSITDCSHLFNDFPLGNGYVQMLSEMFNKKISIRQPVSRSGNPDSSNVVQIKNYGFDGFTVARVLDNIRQHRISLHRSPIITLLIGINDIGLMMNTDRTADQQKQMMSEFSDHYEELLKLLTADARQVILMEPFIFPHPEEYRIWIPYVRIMSKLIRKLSEKYRLPFLPLHDDLNEIATEEGFDAVTIDGIHLTAHGHELLARKLYPLILSCTSFPNSV